jgi:dipeptide/tripeptide permease
MNDFAVVDFKPRTLRPVLGPALWLFGSALWSYVVAGELVVAQGFPEVFGALGVLFALGVTWLFALEHSFLNDPPTPETRAQRVFAPLGIALALWLTALLLSAAVGLSSNANLDGLITCGLWLFSLIPFFIGRRMTRSRHAELGPSRRALAILLSIGAALVTVVALLSVLD